MGDSVKILRVERGRSVAVVVFTYRGWEYSAVNYMSDRFEGKVYDLKMRVLHRKSGQPRHRTFASCNFVGAEMVITEDLMDLIPRGYYRLITDDLYHAFRSAMIEAGW